MPETAAKAEPPAPVGVGGRLPRYDRLFAVLLVVITILAYLPVWQAGFIWDDDTLLLDNSAIKTAGGLAQLWARDFPLATTSLWVEWRLWGANPLGYHVANVLLHALSTVLLWRVLRRLSIPGAGLAAAIFAVHPVNAESVAWISERKNTLCMVFYLLSLLLYLRSDREEPERVSRRPLLAYWLSVAMFELALLSKTAVAPLPVVLLVLAWWQQGRLRLKDLWRAAPFFALGAAAGLMSVWFQTHQAIGASMLDVRADSFWARLAGAGWAIWFYLYKALLPLGLSFIYPRWQIDPTHALSYLPTLLVLVTLLIFWCYRRTWGKALLLSFAYFVLMLLPILGFVSIYFMRYSLVADHWQYFAVIGPIAMVSALLTLGVRKVAASPAWLGPVAGGALVLALGLLTWREALTYRSLKTLWTATVARNPTAGIAHNNLGTILLAEGKVDEAIAHFQRAVALQPNAADAYSNLGGALLEKGRVEEAVLQLRKAVQIQPDAANAQINLGNALARQGQFDEAVAHLREALRLHPEHPGPHYNLGNILLQAGRLDEARTALEQSLALEPAFAEAHLALGTALLGKGQTAQAFEHFSKALQLSPELPAAHLNVANALVQHRRPDEAIPHFQQVLARQPGSAVAHNGLANALAQKGQAAEALAHYEAALKLDPRFAEADLNLGNLLLQQNRLDEAIAQFEAALKLQPNLPAAHNNLANALLAKGRSDEAIAHFEQALKLQPDLAEAHNGLANACLQRGRVADAVTHYKAALAALPNHPYLLNNLAWVLAACPDASLRNGAEAVRLAEKGNQVAPAPDASLLGTLAAAYAEAGRFNDAIKTAQQALELATARNSTTQIETLRKALALYQSGSPSRDAAMSANATTDRHR